MMQTFLSSHGVNPAWLPLYLLALFLGVAALLAWLGGWRELALQFPANGKPQGETFRFRSAGIQKWRVPANYNNCVHIIISRDGLYLAMSFFFRFQHSLIFIPWQQIEQITQEKHWFGKVATLQPRGSKIRVHLLGKAGEAVAGRFSTGLYTP